MLYEKKDPVHCKAQHKKSSSRRILERCFVCGLLDKLHMARSERGVQPLLPRGISVADLDDRSI